MATGPTFNPPTTESSSLSVNFHGEQIQAVKALLEELFPEATTTSEFPTAMTLAMPSVRVSSAFEQMERRGPDAGVTAWALTQTDLDDVFNTVCQQDVLEGGS